MIHIIGAVVTVGFAYLFAVDNGRIHALIGPNGAGKSTTFNCISRYYRPSSGSIRFNGADITKKKPHEMAALGVARTFQNLELFGALSVRENALLGTYAHGANRAGKLLRPAAAESRERVEHLLERVGLSDFMDTPACSLDFGRQKMLELARALAISPKLLLLDEPAAGLRNREIAEKLNHQLVARALSLEGTCTGEHGVGLHKMEFLVTETGAGAVDMMRTIKRALDPKNIMNPGKIFSM